MSAAAGELRMPAREQSGSRRLRILLSAYACHPEQGSEPAVGWHWLRAIARHHDVWLLTEAQRFAAPTAMALAQDPQLQSAVTVIGVPRHRGGERWFGPLAYYETYRRWQRQAYELAVQLHRTERFDIAHQLNMIGYREPGYLWQLDVPFVWGPIGGFAQMPWRYLISTGCAGTLTLGARNLANVWQMRTDGRVRQAMARASAVFAATRTDAAAIAAVFRRQAAVIHETGCDDIQAAAVRQLRKGQPLRVLWCGQMIPSKAIGLALRAVAHASNTMQLEFHLYGRDPAGQSAARATALGITALCQFHGQQPRSEVMQAMLGAHVLLFPSLKEATSATVPEALASGLPVICHDLCGQADLVDESCGVRIPVDTPARSVERMAHALVRMSDPQQLERLSMGALRRSQAFLWNAKAPLLEAIYRTVAGDAAALSERRA